MHDENSKRLARLEQKVDWILRFVAVQLAATCLFGLSYGISYLFRLASTFMLLLIVAVPLLYVFRNSLPNSTRSALTAAGKRTGKFLTAIIWRKKTSA